MGFGPGSSDSKSSQTSIDVSGSGQYNKGSDVAQGGGVLVGRKAKVGSSEYKVNSKGAVTINQGLQPNDFESLIGKLTAATPQQQQAAAPVVVTTPAAPSSTGAADAGASMNTKYLLYGAGAIALGLLARTFFKK